MNERDKTDTELASALAREPHAGVTKGELPRVGKPDNAKTAIEEASARAQDPFEGGE